MRPDGDTAMVHSFKRSSPRSLKLLAMIAFSSSFAWAMETPGFRRPIAVCQTARSLDKSDASELRTCCSMANGTQKSALMMLVPVNPASATPTTAYGRPPSAIVVPMAAGSPLKRSIQKA